MQQGCKGAGTADEGQLFQSKHGSEAGDGGEVTHEMGRTEEKKQRCPPSPLEFPREVCNEFGNDSKSGRLQRKEGAGTADGGQLFQSKHGSEAGDRGELTREMGRTEEKKQ